jgi:hypothetical protein
VQDFIPSPFDVAACMYHTGYDPMTMKPVTVKKGATDRKTQRALLQFWKPENWFLVKDALTRAGRTDLIGDGTHCLIRRHPPREALDAKRRRATARASEQTAGDHIRGRPGGYRPARTTARRRAR